MDYELTWGGTPEDLLVVMRGRAVPENLDAWGHFLETVVSDARWQPPMRVLLDERQVDFGALDARGIELRAAQAAAYDARIGQSRIAAVMGEAIDFGLVRMEQAHVEAAVRHGLVLRIFRSLEEGRQWLRPAADGSAT